MINLLGIDNVFFSISNLENSISFYEKLGFKLKFKIPSIKGALFAIGSEEPGLILSQKEKVLPSKLWVEVESAENIKQFCETLDISGQLLVTATGFTFEMTDFDGNIIGFADYSKKPELARRMS